MDPALAQWLASLNRPVAPVTPPPSGGAPGGIDTPAIALDTIAAKSPLDAGAAKNLPPPLPADAADKQNLKSAEHKALGLELPQAADRNSAETALIAAFGERQDTPQPTERAAAADTSHAIGALAATGAAGPAHRTEPAAAPLPVSLPTPVTAPEFKGALSMQVSVLARDGIQHAELHLNPAEMGPISVQIALDGSQARVDFGADSATTRQIIEAGLPELASALRDAGLTLSGGGVSQHSRGQSQGDGTPPQRGGSRTAGDPVDSTSQGAHRVNLRLPLGAVDLYA
jgi:flagellar hook-length control protein FliK